MRLNQDETVKLKGCEWPLKRYGQLSFDSESEDGSWDGYSVSGDNTGANLAWIDPAEVALIKPDEIVLSRETLYRAFAKALNVEDAWGWTTGKDIADALFGKINS